MKNAVSYKRELSVLLISASLRKNKKDVGKNNDIQPTMLSNWSITLAIRFSTQ